MNVTLQVNISKICKGWVNASVQDCSKLMFASPTYRGWLYSAPATLCHEEMKVQCCQSFRFLKRHSECEFFFFHDNFKTSKCSLEKKSRNHRVDKTKHIYQQNIDCEFFIVQVCNSCCRNQSKVWGICDIVTLRLSHYAGPFHEEFEQM